MKSSIIIILIFCLGASVQGQVTNLEDSIIKSWTGLDPLVDDVLNNRQTHKLQVQVSTFQADTLITSTIGAGSYYYPASLVKFPTVLSALNKMDRMGLSLDDKIMLHNLDINGSKSFISKTKKGVTFRELIEQTIVVSDNDYYNVLYHFVTPKYLNDYLKFRGFDDVLIYRCFNGCSKEDQLKTAAYSIFSNSDSLKYNEKESLLDWASVLEEFTPSDDKRIGNRFIKEGKVIQGPYDFNENLEFPINSVHDMMISFISDSTDETWQIGEDKRFFLIEKLSQSPVDIGIDKYSIQDFKIIAFGNQELDNSRFVTYSKIGYSYGFITETAYVKDTISKSGFFLTISMYVNKNNTINDGRYQYGTVATPFMGTLTHIIANQLIDK
jgi:hypothetical protein